MTTAWYDDDSFWDDFAAFMFPSDRWAKTPLEVDGILALTGVAAGGGVLDLCCGPGRHSLDLARRGFRVTGVDRTVAYLARARASAAAEGLAIDFVHADMREFARPAAFDLALSLFTSFGYFERPEDDRAVVRHVCESLRPGGCFVMEMMGKEVLARIYGERRWETVEDGSWVLQESRLGSHWGWIENRWILVKEGRQREHRFGHRLYAATELVSLLEGVGFSTVRSFGDLGGSPYDQRAQRLVVVARK